MVLFGVLCGVVVVAGSDDCAFIASHRIALHRMASHRLSWQYRQRNRPPRVS